jgi:hypothetical protein
MTRFFTQFHRGDFTPKLKMPALFAQVRGGSSGLCLNHGLHVNYQLVNVRHTFGVDDTFLPDTAGGSIACRQQL